MPTHDPFAAVTAEQDWQAGIRACASIWKSDRKRVLTHLGQVYALSLIECKHELIREERTPKGWNAWCSVCGAEAWARERFEAVDLVEYGHCNVSLPRREGALYLLTCCHEISKASTTNLEIVELIGFWQSVLDNLFGDAWYGLMAGCPPFSPVLDDDEIVRPGVVRNGVCALLILPNSVRVLPSSNVRVELPMPKLSI